MHLHFFTLNVIIPVMAIETVGHIIICTCNVPTCCGKGKTWAARYDKPPKVCRWCRNPNWNRPRTAERIARKAELTERISRLETKP